ncbi:MAG: thioredoxin [Candidatus Kerfeldbacteria bacterium CG_4_10_14_0_8_um_filter_42_10]|uniref:Thioredoxin n=1 Tax=Candidatus Kerfeldbacteria bacterium CG_4_10_14_0_8_um_filter_42_10 TaxID=2014248 RepID=A0A2M7RIX6_9BACT|nr:MAG: thioredoxin [Candidatus Kerfeldbacteria bacterium CG_4_10_14_0_8_um_filter_42_10]
MPEIKITDQNFEEEVIKSSQPVLIDFWAEWCGPCKIMLPIVEDLAKEYEGKPVKIGKMNVDENPQTVGQFGILSIPTFILFKDGKPINQQAGALPKEKLQELIDQAL